MVFMIVTSRNGKLGGHNFLPVSLLLFIFHCQTRSGAQADLFPLENFRCARIPGHAESSESDTDECVSENPAMHPFQRKCGFPHF